MKTLPHIDVIYTHTEGEPACIVHAGVRYPHGLDILGKRRHLESQYDGLLPTIKGKANVTGYAKWVFDADDPVGAGFLVA